MIIIKLSRKTHQLKVRQVQRSVSIRHSGARGIPGQDGKDGIGLPEGGTSNQVLQKASDSDYDFRWQTPSFEDKYFTTTFSVTDNVLVQHNLNKYPAVSIIDSAGDEVEGSVFYIDSSSLLVTFAFPFSGRITCN